MKCVGIFVGLMLCATAKANVSAAPRQAIDTAAPGYFARAVGRSDCAVIPGYDSAKGAMREPVTIRDRAQFDQLALIFEHATFMPTSHVLAVAAGGPIKFYAADKHEVLTWEALGDVLRLNYEDYRIDKKSTAALHQWLKNVTDNPSRNRSAPEATAPAASEQRH